MPSTNLFSPYKTNCASTPMLYAVLTQPTEVTADWAGVDFITHPSLYAPVGYSGRFDSARRKAHQNRPDTGGMDMQTQKQTKTRFLLISALKNLRQEWQEAANGSSLIAIHASVGLLLADVVMAVGLDTLDQIQVLGADLAHELDEFFHTESGTISRA